MEMQSILDFIMNLILLLTSIVGGASLIVEGLKQIAKVTPTEKDDAYLDKAGKFLNRVTVFLDKLALNPDQSKARVPK